MILPEFKTEITWFNQEDLEEEKALLRVDGWNVIALERKIK